MRIRKQMRNAAGLGAVMALLSATTAAQASGRLPVIPTTQRFASHDACVTVLQTFFAADQRQAVAKTTSANGDTHEIDLDSKGVERIAAEKARYDATVWAHNGRYRAEFQQVEVNHSFVHRIRECDGSVLTTRGEDGYTLSTLEPATAPAAGAPR